MSERAVAGHGVSLAVELDPVGAPGVFDEVPELNGDLNWFNFSVPETNVTAHNDDIDSWIQGVLMREPLSGTVNYVFDDEVHQTLRDSPLTKLKRGWRLRGPGWSTPAEDEIIASGFVQSFGPIVHPVREGARTAAFNVRMSGPMIVDGVSYGT